MNTSSPFEKKIIRSVYRYETKRTVRNAVVITFLLLLLGLTLYGIGGVALHRLISFGVYDVILAALSDMRNFVDYMQTGLEITLFEVPIEGIVIILVTLVSLFYLLVQLWRNRKVIGGRLISLIRYWFARRHRQEK